MAKYDEDNYGPALIQGWEERDRKAEEKENKRKGRPIQKPPRKKKRQGRKDVEELEMAMAAPIPGSEKPPWNTDRTGKQIPRVAKKGGRVRGYSSGGKVHRAGLARRRRS